MELKRILANDTKSATEKAMALYGRNVLVISNHSVGGQTELVVAIDIEEPAQAGGGDNSASVLLNSGTGFKQQLAKAQLQPKTAAAKEDAKDVFQDTASNRSLPVRQSEPKTGKDFASGEIMDLILSLIHI